MNDEKLRNVAAQSTEKLRRGLTLGLNVNKNLSVFTGLPGENKEIYDTERILTTLAQNFTVILIDADFNTPLDYFARSMEIYAVQSLDILTIQPFTAFLRDLKRHSNELIFTSSIQSVCGGVIRSGSYHVSQVVPCIPPLVICNSV